MGELAKAEAKYPAPWEGATAEEDHAYSQQVEFGNMEFEADVRHAMGPVGAEYIDADRARMIRGSWTLQGLHVPDEFNYDDERYEKTIERYGPVMQRADATLEADMVYAVGTHNARPELWAHEFMHRRHTKEDIRFKYQLEETAVRKKMGFRAQTPDQWLRSVETWRSVMLNRQVENDYESISLDEAETHLKNTLETNTKEYLSEETDYLKKGDYVPKTRKWASDSHSADAREALEWRQKSWNIKNATRYKRMKERQAAKDKQE